MRISAAKSTRTIPIAPVIGSMFLTISAFQYVSPLELQLTKLVVEANLERMLSDQSSIL